INAKSRVKPSIAGTFASIIAHSNEIEKGTFVLTMSRSSESTTKISLRIAGGSHGTDADLNKMLSRITKATGGESGGHKNAAGAIIDSVLENKYIQESERVFKETSIEEIVN
ncbi:MAG: DHHA1 domain-containing protein, partial [Nanobdellota archaeon]